MKFSFAVGFSIAVLFILFQSCKDIGDVVPPPPITFSVGTVSVAVGNTRSVIISGGTRPYVIASNSDPAKVTATISNDTLQLRGIVTGSATVVVGDNGSPRQTSSIAVTIVLLSIGQNTFNLIAGDTATTTLSGGTLPYSFVSRGDSTKVLPTITGSALTLRALVAGSSTITIGDASSPQLTVTVNATVIAAVLFSSQVQPIFTSSCAVSGCHLPGGTGPMSLAAGVSRGTLVGIPATNGIGQCPGDKRVQPSNADASVLVKRITGTCGLAQMPLGGTPLSTAQIQLIRDWINQGARNN